MCILEDTKDMNVGFVITTSGNICNFIIVHLCMVCPAQMPRLSRRLYITRPSLFAKGVYFSDTLNCIDLWENLLVFTACDIV